MELQSKYPVLHKETCGERYCSSSQQLVREWSIWLLQRKAFIQERFYSSTFWWDMIPVASVDVGVWLWWWLVAQWVSSRGMRFRDDSTDSNWCGWDKVTNLMSGQFATGSQNRLRLLCSTTFICRIWVLAYFDPMNIWLYIFSSAYATFLCGHCHTYTERLFFQFNFLLKKPKNP